MGNLSNLYISQSFTSLAHLGTNNALVPGTMTQLEDGIGQSLNISFDGTNISSSGNIFAANITASVINTGSLVNTSSFNSYTQSTNIRLTNIESTTASLNSSVSNLNTATASLFTSASLALVTASFNSGTRNLTFTKGNGTTFNVNIPDVSGSTINTGSFATTGSNIFYGDQVISGSGFNGLTVTNGIQADYFYTDGQGIFTPTLYGANVGLGKLQIEALDGVNINGNLTASLQQGYVWVGDSLNKSILVATSSLVTNINTGSLVTTASFNQYTQSNNQRVSSLETNSASVNISISNLNVFTASQSTASIVTSITNLNNFTSSANSRLNNIETTTASLLIETQNLELFSASALVSISNLNQSSASQQVSINALNQFTASQSTASIVTSINELNTFSASAKISINALNSATSSYITESETASFARTNVDNNFTANQTFTNITAVSASFTYIQTLYETASVIYSSGSNQLGDELTDIQILSGSVKVQGSLTVNGTPVLTSSVDISGLVTTASFNQYTQSNNQRVSSLEVNSASVNTSIGNLNTATSSLFTSASLSLTTASISGQNITFRKGDGTTFNILIPTASFFTSSISVSGSITISGSIENVDYIDFNTASAVPTWKSGRVYWDNTDGALSVYNAEADISMQLGQEMWVRVRNQTGTTITNGSVVRLTGALGDNPTIVLAQSVEVSGSVPTTNQILGVATHDIETGTNGYVTTLGNVRGLNTSAYNEGDVLWVSSSAGLLTKVVPVAPFERIPVATVVKSGPGGSGIIYVAPIPPIDFASLSSVEISGSYETDDVWIYEGNVWKHKLKSDIGLTTTSSFNSYTQSTDSRLNNIESTTASLNSSVSQLNASSASQQISIDNLNTTTASLNNSVSNLNTATASLFTSASLGLTTASFSGNTLTFTKGDNSTFGIVIPDVSGSTINTGSFATTGSNSFTGDQTLIDNAGNFFTISDASGSLMLVAKGFTSASLHLSASAAGIGNIIFKTNNNTADTIVSGSNNIFTNPTAPPAGFKRYLTSNNIALGAGFPTISGSMGFSPNVSNNYFVGGITMRGPVSASTWTITGNNIQGNVLVGTGVSTHGQGLTSGLALTNNVIPGTLGMVANQAALTASQTAVSTNIIPGTVVLSLNQSAAQFVNNIVNDGNFTLTNNYFSQSAGLGVVNVLRSNILGQSNSIIVTGSQPAGTTNAPSYNDNFIGGGGNIIFADVSTARVSGTTAYHSAARNIIFGQNLIVSASSFVSDTTGLGSAFFGRFNSVTGNADMTAETIFAVGTGTSTSNRKTGFLIDSGSNSFFEGTVNISGSLLVNGVSPAATNTGSLMVTGSVLGNVLTFTKGDASTFSLTVDTGSGGGGGTIPAGTVSSSAQILAYNIFAITGSNSFLGNQTISGSLIVSGSTTLQGNTTFIDRSNTNNNNVYLGNNALASNTTGNSIVAIGQNALQKNTTGTNNFAMGSNAMVENISGVQNVAIGVGALYSSTSGSINTAIGNDAMIFASGSNMSNNIAIGGSSLTRNQVDSQIAIGNNALEKTTTGNVNTAIGRNAMRDNLTGNNNVAIGSNALLLSTASLNTIAIGSVAMRDAGASEYNTAIGTAALYSAKSNSSYNVAIGGNALRFHFDGDTDRGQNMAIGTDAMSSMTSGSRNVAIGTGTLRDSTRANRNVMVGTNIGLNARPVSNNVAIGDGIGIAIAGNENTIIGSSAATNITSGSDNIIIGYNTGDSITTGNNNTVIGSNLSGDATWNNAIAIADGASNIKFFNSGSQTTLTNNTLISGSLTTTGSATIGTVLQLTGLDPLPAGATGQLAVSASLLWFYDATQWRQVSLV